MELGRSSRDGEPAKTREMSAKPISTGPPRFSIVPADSGDDPTEAAPGLAHEDVPDVALIAALGAGEVEALGVLYDRHARSVCALLVRIAGERDVAEEILQEVFLRVWQHAHTYDDTRGSVRSWLHGIAYNLALNELRRRRRRPQLQQPAASADQDGADYAGCFQGSIDPAVHAWSAIRDAELTLAVDRLPQGQRAVLLLYAEGFSQSEIAARLGEPLGTVKSRMRRALCRLRETLPALGIDAGWWSD